MSWGFATTHEQRMRSLDGTTPAAEPSRQRALELLDRVEGVRDASEPAQRDHNSTPHVQHGAGHLAVLAAV